MLNLLNAADVWTSLVDMLKDGVVIFAMVLTCIGIVCAVCAGKLAKVIRRREIEKNDSIKLTFKIIGLVLIILSLIIMAIPSVGLLIKG